MTVKADGLIVKPIPSSLSPQHVRYEAEPRGAMQYNLQRQILGGIGGHRREHGNDEIVQLGCVRLFSLDASVQDAALLKIYVRRWHVTATEEIL